MCLFKSTKSHASQTATTEQTQNIQSQFLTISPYVTITTTSHATRLYPRLKSLTLQLNFNFTFTSDNSPSTVITNQTDLFLPDSSFANRNQVERPPKNGKVRLIFSFSSFFCFLRSLSRIVMQKWNVSIHFTSVCNSTPIETKQNWFFKN